LLFNSPNFVFFIHHLLLQFSILTRTYTNPNGTEANAAGRSGNARALRKQSKFGMIQEGRRERGIGQIPRKFAKSEEFMGVAHSAEQ
jgi:hypothetical protein